MIIFKNTKKDGGYALLFTVVVVGIISMITIGLSNAAYKYIVLSSVARDSAISFYQSDLAAECILYADNTYNMEIPTSPTWSCAGYNLSITKTGPSPAGVTLYNINPVNENVTSKCFRAIVTKTEDEISIKTKVEAMGYNICNKSNIRTVERTIEVNY